MRASPWRIVRVALCLGAIALTAAPAARAQRVHLLVVNGLAGEPQYRASFRAVTAALVDSARSRWGVADSSLIVLGEDPADDPKRIRGRSTRAEVQQAFLTMGRRVAAGDVVLVFLNGHGAGEGAGSRINLPGPDPTAADYSIWLTGFSRQSVVFVNAGSGSGDFVKVLRAPGRLVVTATRTALERNETIFARPFVRGLVGTEADADKDGRVSVFEAFDHARKEVAREYETGNKMLTEHAALSDTALARRITFGAPRGSANPRVLALTAERQELETQVAALRARKASMAAAAYDRELERLLLQIAEKTQAIRAAGARP